MSYFEVKSESGDKHVTFQPDFMDTRRRQGNGQTNKAHHRRRITRRRFFVKQSSKFTQEQNHLQIITKKTLFHYSRISTMFSQLVILLAIFILNFCRNHVPGKKTTQRDIYTQKRFTFVFDKSTYNYICVKNIKILQFEFDGEKNPFLLVNTEFLCQKRSKFKISS